MHPVGINKRFCLGDGAGGGIRAEMWKFYGTINKRGRGGTSIRH